MLMGKICLSSTLFYIYEVSNIIYIDSQIQSSSQEAAEWLQQTVVYFPSSHINGAPASAPPKLLVQIQASWLNN